MIRIELERTVGEFGMEARDMNGHLLQTDTAADSGGSDSGFRPMQLLLAALGSCSAIDIISILNKQRQIIKGINILIEGERDEERIPSLWKFIHMRIILNGNIEPAKARKACQLSIEKYCSVAETLRRAGAKLQWEVDTLPDPKIEQ